MITFQNYELYLKVNQLIKWKKTFLPRYDLNRSPLQLKTGVLPKSYADPWIATFGPFVFTTLHCKLFIGLVPYSVSYFVL